MATVGPAAVTVGSAGVAGALTALATIAISAVIAARLPDMGTQIALLQSFGTPTSVVDGLINSTGVARYSYAITTADKPGADPCLVAATANALGCSPHDVRGACATFFHDQLHSDYALNPRLNLLLPLVQLIDGTAPITNSRHAAALTLVTHTVFQRNLFIRDLSANTTWTPQSFDAALPSIVIQHTKGGTAVAPFGHFAQHNGTASEAVIAAQHLITIPDHDDRFLVGAGVGPLVECPDCKFHCPKDKQSCTMCAAALAGAPDVRPARDFVSEQRQLLLRLGITAVPNAADGNCLPRAVGVITSTGPAEMRTGLADRLSADADLRKRIYAERDDDAHHARITDVRRDGTFLEDAELLALAEIFNLKFCVVSTDLTSKTTKVVNIAHDDVLRRLFPDGLATPEGIAATPPDYHIIVHTPRVPEGPYGAGTPDHWQLGHAPRPFAAPTTPPQVPHAPTPADCSLHAVAGSAVPPDLGRTAFSKGTATTASGTTVVTPAVAPTPVPYVCQVPGCRFDASVKGANLTGIRSHINSKHGGNAQPPPPDSIRCLREGCSRWFQPQANGSPFPHKCAGTRLPASPATAAPVPSDAAAAAALPPPMPLPPPHTPSPATAQTSGTKRRRTVAAVDAPEPPAACAAAPPHTLPPRPPVAPPHAGDDCAVPAPERRFDPNSVPLTFAKPAAWKRSLRDLFSAYGQATSIAERNDIFLAILARPRHSALPRNKHVNATGSTRRWTEPASELDTAQLAVEHALRELRLGTTARANRALSSSGIYPVDDTLEAKLRTKYPQAPAGEQLRPTPADPALAPTLTQDMVFNLVARKAKSSGGGPDRWSWADLQLILQQGSPVADSALAGLTALLNDVAKGTFTQNPLLHKTLISCRGVPLRKAGKDDVRPIGIGNIFLSAATSLVISSKGMLDLIPAAVGEHQLCIGTQGGSEALPEIIRAHLRLHPTHVVANTDVANAFNSITRTHVLATASLLPPLAPIINAIYTQTIPVIYEGRGRTIRIDNTRGVTQGGPESALLFAAATRPAVEYVLSRNPSVRIIGYADDIYFLGEPGAVIAAVADYEQALAQLGLTVQRAKSELWDPLNRPEATGAAMAAGLKPVDGVVAVGAPVGTPVFTMQFIATEVTLMCEHVQRVTSVGRAAAAHPGSDQLTTALYRLIRNCLAPAKINYLLRTNETAYTRAHAQRYDHAVHGALAAVLGTAVGDPRMNPDTDDGRTAMSISQLKASSGGLGLTSAVKTADAARFGSLLLTANVVAKFVGDGFNPITSGREAIPELFAYHNTYKDHLARGLTKPIEALDVTTDTLFSSQLSGMSRALSSQSAASRRDEVLRQLTPSLAAWVRSGGDNGGRFLRASGHTLKPGLTDAEFRAMLRVRIGLSPTDDTPLHGTCQRKGCRSEHSALHNLYCMEGGQGGLAGQRSARHAVVKAAVITTINDCARKCGHNIFADSTKEPAYKDFYELQPGTNREQIDRHLAGQRNKVPVRGDILTAASNGGSRIGDFVVTHARPQNKRHAGSDNKDNVANCIAYAQKQTELEKYYVLRGAGERHKFYPIAFETGGRLHPSSLKYFEAVTADIINKPEASRTAADKAFYATTLTSILDAASVALAKSVARSLLDTRHPLKQFAPDPFSDCQSECEDEDDDVSCASTLEDVEMASPDEQEPLNAGLAAMNLSTATM